MSAVGDNVFPVDPDNPTMQRVALNIAKILEIISKNPDSWEVHIGMMAALVDFMRLVYIAGVSVDHLPLNEKEVLYWRNKTRSLYGMSQITQIHQSGIDAQENHHE
jgi:hypothetical protein